MQTALRDWRDRQADDQLRLAEGYEDHQLVFATATGQPGNAAATGERAPRTTSGA